MATRSTGAHNTLASSRRMLIAALSLALTGPALAQTIIDPADPARAAIREQNKRRTTLEREFKKIRFEHFGDKGNPKVRAAGLEKLRSYTDPAGFQPMIEVFGNEKSDVRTALIDHFWKIGTRESIGALAWAAVTSKNADLRAMATARLAASIDVSPASSDDKALVVKNVVLSAINSNNDEVMRNAANLAGILGMVEAIPALILAQSGPSTAVTGASQPEGDLAYIFVGRQQAFVSDLTPVVSESAVAFDPTVSVLSTGTLLRVSGAVVTTERVEIHTSLVGLSSGLTGADTSGLGYNLDAWKKWHQEIYEPRIRELASAKPR